jgi:hypothetical protein
VRRARIRPRFCWRRTTTATRSACSDGHCSRASSTRTGSPSTPAEAQRLATLHFRQTRLLVAEHWNEHERRDGDPALPLFTEDIRDRAELARRFGTKGQRHWTTQGLPDRIAAVLDVFPQDRDGELQARYADDNRLANLLLHGAAVALNDRILDDELGNATVHTGPPSSISPTACGTRTGPISGSRCWSLTAAAGWASRDRQALLRGVAAAANDHRARTQEGGAQRPMSVRQRPEGEGLPRSDLMRPLGVP